MNVSLFLVLVAGFNCAVAGFCAATALQAFVRQDPGMFILDCLAVAVNLAAAVFLLGRVRWARLN